MDQISFFYNGWEPLFRLILVGSLAYLSVMLLLRLRRSSSLAELTLLDFIILIALGTTLARALTAPEVVLSEAVASFVLLALLQYTTGRFQLRSKRISGPAPPMPALLFYQGRFVSEEMHRLRWTEAELRAAVLHHGVTSIQEVEA